MANFTSIPKDLSKIKPRLAFNLTKRQIICFGGAVAVGIPVYIFTHRILGNSVAAILMIALMLPGFFLAMYERDGQPAEKIVGNYIRARFLSPRVRPYRTENLYDYLRKSGGKTIANQNKSATNRTTVHPVPRHVPRRDLPGQRAAVHKNRRVSGRELPPRAARGSGRHL